MVKPILFIVGQTATGKTNLAVSLSQHISSTVISADSRQVYKGMDIGTGKDLPSNGTQVYMQNEVFPNEDWSVSHYVQAATSHIQHAWDEKKMPIIVGGTGMYCDALLGKYASIHIHQNPALRHELEQLTLPQLQHQLQEKNAERFKHMNNSDRNNPRRLIRALEVASAKSETPPQTLVRERNALWIGLSLPLETLEKRIVQRVQDRFAYGMIEETSALMTAYSDWSKPAFSATGYQEVRAYIEKNISKEQCIQQWALHELQYAKRQLTWFKKNPNIRWFDALDHELHNKVENAVQSWYDSVYATH